MVHGKVLTAQTGLTHHSFFFSKQMLSHGRIERAMFSAKEEREKGKKRRYGIVVWALSLGHLRGESGDGWLLCMLQLFIES